MEGLSDKHVLLLISCWRSRTYFPNMRLLIQQLLIPYVEILEKGSDVKSIINWLKLIFKSSVADDMSNAINYYIEDVLRGTFYVDSDDSEDEDGTMYDEQRINRDIIGSKCEDVDDFLNSETCLEDSDINKKVAFVEDMVNIVDKVNLLSGVKVIIVNHLLYKIINTEIHIQNLPIHHETAILPWDIYRAFNNLVLPEYRKANTILITIKCDNIGYRDNLTLDYFCGLLLFFQVCKHSDVEMAILNHAFPRDYLISSYGYGNLRIKPDLDPEYDIKIFRYASLNNHKKVRNWFGSCYIIVVDEQQYLFFSRDFITGFIKGSVLSNVDYKQYYDEIKYYESPTDTGKIIEI